MIKVVVTGPPMLMPASHDGSESDGTLNSTDPEVLEPNAMAKMTRITVSMQPSFKEVAKGFVIAPRGRRRATTNDNEAITKPLSSGFAIWDTPMSSPAPNNHHAPGWSIFDRTVTRVSAGFSQ